MALDLELGAAALLEEGCRGVVLLGLYRSLEKCKAEERVKTPQAHGPTAELFQFLLSFVNSQPTHPLHPILSSCSGIMMLNS